MDKQRIDYQPPTEEQWARLPEWLKWRIFFMVLFHSWESALGEIGLKIGGLKML